MSVDCFHIVSLPFQHMYSQYSLQGSVCVFCVSHRNSTTSLRVEILSLCAASQMWVSYGNSSTGGWFGILGGTHEKDCVLFMSRLTNKFGFTLQDCNRVMEHTRFLLLTRSTSAEDCCSRIERGMRKIAECTSYTTCVLLSFPPIY